MVRPAILLDVDDVLLDWSTPFHAWMEERRYQRDHAGAAIWDLADSYPGLAWADIKAEIDAFAMSDAYRDLTLRDGVMNELNCLASAGLSLYAVTCCGRHPKIAARREYQLRELPLDGVFTLEHDESKAGIYARFMPGCVVVDDAPKHLRAAMQSRHATVVFDTPGNRDFIADARIERWSPWGAVHLIRQLRCI